MSARRVGTCRVRVAHWAREEWLPLGVAARQRVTYRVNDPGFANPFARRGHFVQRGFGKEGVRSWNTNAHGARRWAWAMPGAQATSTPYFSFNQRNHTLASESLGMRQSPS